MEICKSVKVVRAELYFLPVDLRVPLKFGDQILSSVKCARVRVEIESSDGMRAEGWGETPLSAAWVWPSSIEYHIREKRLIEVCKLIAASYIESDLEGHPFDIGYQFIGNHLGDVISSHNKCHEDEEPLPYLGALVAFSAFDLAVYDAYAKMNDCRVFEVFNENFLNFDLSKAFDDERFSGKVISDYLEPPKSKLPVWHLVGGLDPLDNEELIGNEPNDGYPNVLSDWIRTDGLKCLKVKLKGTDWDWDFARMLKVFSIANNEGVDFYSTDFNCTVMDPEYVNSILDALKKEASDSYEKLLYVEQPFPYELDKYMIDVTSVAERKSIYLDESAHDWTYVKLGKSLGWNGVALKTCKTLTGAMLSLSWAKENGLKLMVQDLTNPMLAQIPHVLLAANAGTIMGVESNAMQFYPEASLPEAKVHPGIYKRTDGNLDLSTLGNSGFGYKINEINRDLPDPAFVSD